MIDVIFLLNRFFYNLNGRINWDPSWIRKFRIPFSLGESEVYSSRGLIKYLSNFHKNIKIGLETLSKKDWGDIVF
jgi:hypothetical protein